MRPLLIPSLLAALAIGGAAVAQSPHGSHAKASSKESAATKAYRAANDKMHKAMSIRFSNDADVDFIKGMIPHHRGAIDMAKVVLQYGKNDQTKKWAQDIIREQQREIGEMEAWLKANNAQ